MQCRLSKADARGWVEDGLLKINLDDRYIYTFEVKKAIERKYDSDLLYTVIVYQIADLIKNKTIKLPINFFETNGYLSYLGNIYFREMNRNLLELIHKEIWPAVQNTKLH